MKLKYEPRVFFLASAITPAFLNELKIQNVIKRARYIGNAGGGDRTACFSYRSYSFKTFHNFFRNDVFLNKIFLHPPEHPCCTRAFCNLFNFPKL